MKPTKFSDHPEERSDRDSSDQASLWVIRHDRGLSAQEQDEFSEWLTSDAKHRAAWAQSRWGWEELDRLAGLQNSVHAVPDPDLLAPPKVWWRRYFVPVMAAAAAVFLGVFVWLSRSPTYVAREVSAGSRVLAMIERRELSDGSTIELNRGAVVTEHFSQGERRVRLERGEAYFKVAKDVNRPFYVDVSSVSVRAVGTAFNVRLDPASVEVLVTEGKVGVERSASSDAMSTRTPVHLVLGERTLVSLAPDAPPPQVSVVPPAEMEARLAWQPRLLDFTNAPLTEIVSEFNRRNQVRLTAIGTELAQLRLSATFRSDNVDGFVRLMESDFGIKADWISDTEIVLSKTL